MTQQRRALERRIGADSELSVNEPPPGDAGRSGMQEIVLALRRSRYSYPNRPQMTEPILIMIGLTFTGDALRSVTIRCAPASHFATLSESTIDHAPKRGGWGPIFERSWGGVKHAGSVSPGGGYHLNQCGTHPDPPCLRASLNLRRST